MYLQEALSHQYLFMYTYVYVGLRHDDLFFCFCHMKSFEWLSSKYSRQQQLAGGNTAAVELQQPFQFFLFKQIGSNSVVCSRYSSWYNSLHTIKGIRKNSAFILMTAKKSSIYSWTQQQTRGNTITATLLLLLVLFLLTLLLLLLRGP